MDRLSKMQGCLLGGAAGDALGYEVEFDSHGEIFRRFGRLGITRYVKHGGKALISDDTQMTLFTANGLLHAATAAKLTGTDPNYILGIWDCYQDWLKTQDYYSRGIHAGKNAWLNNIPELNHPRAPGNTCLSALHGGVPGSREEPVNNSIGCGGVMRAVPAGLFLMASGPWKEQLASVLHLGEAVGALTHGGGLGYIPSAALAYMVAVLVNDDNASVTDAVLAAREAIQAEYTEAEGVCRMIDLLNRALELAAQDRNDTLTIEQELGSGFTGETALAIAVYCAVKYEDDFEKAMIASVNHNGDSDSTGAICGNILGTRLGLEGIPSFFREDAEAGDVILELAEDLYRGVPANEDGTVTDARWLAKYRDHSYTCGR